MLVVDIVHSLFICRHDFCPSTHGRRTSQASYRDTPALLVHLEAQLGVPEQFLRHLHLALALALALLALLQ